MKKFKRFRTLKELTAICKKNGWLLHTKKFDEGSDFVSFEFEIKTISDYVGGVALFNTVNGQFFGHLNDGETFSSESDKHDNQDWFKVLLKTVYVS